jgi:hypothetical protein
MGFPGAKGSGQKKTVTCAQMWRKAGGDGGCVVGAGKHNMDGSWR